MSGLPHRGEVLEVNNCDDGSFAMSEKYGVVPRGIQRLFDRIDLQTSSGEPDISFTVYCSFVEVSGSCNGRSGLLVSNLRLY
jgi:hypothetical protein